MNQIKVRNNLPNYRENSQFTEIGNYRDFSQSKLQHPSGDSVQPKSYDGVDNIFLTKNGSCLYTKYNNVVWATQNNLKCDVLPRSALSFVPTCDPLSGCMSNQMESLSSY